MVSGWLYHPCTVIIFFGGTDYNRFATFLFLPQVMLLSTLENKVTNQKLIIVLACLFIFNRLWMYFPDWDIQTYRNFWRFCYNSTSTHCTASSNLPGSYLSVTSLHRRGILNNSQM
ncbi:MAG: hypothetical protein IPP55_02680 [Anaerolineales bacterium]|nr:hypothetical protein [Anaerolineales bacterium]